MRFGSFSDRFHIYSQRAMSKRLINPQVHALTVALCQYDLASTKISKQLKISRCGVRNATTKFSNIQF